MSWCHHAQWRVITATIYEKCRRRKPTKKPKTKTSKISKTSVFQRFFIFEVLVSFPTLKWEGNQNLPFQKPLQNLFLKKFRFFNRFFNRFWCRHFSYTIGVMIHELSLSLFFLFFLFFPSLFFSFFQFFHLYCLAYHIISLHNILSYQIISNQSFKCPSVSHYIS